jgi:hypothetical protein
MEIINGFICHAVYLKPRILESVTPVFLKLVHEAVRQGPIFIKRRWGFCFEQFFYQILFLLRSDNGRKIYNPN